MSKTEVQIPAKDEFARMKRKLESCEVSLEIANRSLAEERSTLEAMRKQQEGLLADLLLMRQKNDEADAEIKLIRAEIEERDSLYQLLADARHLVEGLHADLGDARAEIARLRDGA